VWLNTNLIGQKLFQTLCVRLGSRTRTIMTAAAIRAWKMVSHMHNDFRQNYSYLLANWGFCTCTWSDVANKATSLDMTESLYCYVVTLGTTWSIIPVQPMQLGETVLTCTKIKLLRLVSQYPISAVSAKLQLVTQLSMQNYTLK